MNKRKRSFYAGKSHFFTLQVLYLTQQYIVQAKSFGKGIPKNVHILYFHNFFSDESSNAFDSMNIGLVHISLNKSLKTFF